MEDEQRLPWTTILVLSLLALIRPLFNLTGDDPDWGGAGAAPLEVFVAISLVWIVTGVFTVRPVETLAVAGLTYGILAAALVAGLSPVLTGNVQGPLADPLALLASLTGNLLWGVVCGFAAQGVITLRRRAAGRRRGSRDDGPDPDGPSGPAGPSDPDGPPGPTGPGGPGPGRPPGRGW